MKILYDHQIFNLQKYGGISRYFFEIISRMTTFDEVSLFMGVYFNQYLLSDYQADFCHFMGKKRPNFPKKKKIYDKINEFFLSRFARKEKYDIYHPTYFYHYIPELTAKRVVTVYDMIYEKFSTMYKPDDPITMLKRLSVKEADGIICISETTKNDLIDIFGVKEDKVKVIYLANSLKIDVSHQKAIVGEPYILYVGQRGLYKNFKMLVDAYANLPIIYKNFRLICFGGGQLDNHERNYISSKGLTNRISSYVGPDSLLANLYRNATVFIYPSLYEGFGLPPLEAMYYGCPVLVSRSSSIPEVVGDAGVYFDPNDIEDLMYQLERFISNQQMREQYVTKGYQREKVFHWDETTLETHCYYEKLCDA